MADDPSGLQRALGPFRVRNYRYYFAGQLISLAGTWMQTSGLAWLVLEISDSGTALGVVTAAQFVPTLVGGPYGGLVADRFDKRRTLLMTQAGMGLSGAALAAVTLGGSSALWILVLLALATGSFAAVDNPTRQAFVTELVGQRYVATVVGLNSVMFNAARIVGPAMAAVLIRAFAPDVHRGTGICFAVNAASYAAVLAALAMMRAADLQRSTAVPRAKGQIRAGLAYARGEPALRRILLMMAIIGLLALNFQVLLPLIAKDVFDGDAGTFGALTVAMGAGALLGSLVAAARGRTSLRLVGGAATALGVTLSAAAVAPTLHLEIVAWFATGVAMMTLMAASNTTLQLTARPDMRGRVIAFYMLLLMGSTPIGGPIVGFIAESAGPRWSVAMAAGATFVAAGIAFLPLHESPSDARSEPLAATT